MTSRHKTVQTFLLIVCVSIVPVIAIYLPFMLHLRSFWGIPLGESGMQQIYANWDGPNYVLNAVTWYDPQEIAKRAFLARPNEYYAAHFPLHPLLIRAIAPVFGYFPAAIIIQILSGVLVNVVFYLFVRSRTKHPLWLTFVFTVFPPRYMVLRAVISPELLVCAAFVGAIYLWQRDKFFASGVAAFVAVLLKFQSLILVPVYVAVIAERVWHRKSITIGHIVAVVLPLLAYTLIASFYAVTFGDPHAYFRAQSIVHMNMDIPFGLFNYAKRWVQTGWLEDPALYFIGLLTLVFALRRGFPRIYFWFVLFYTAMLSLIPQIDIMRLAMPVAPVAFLAASHLLSARPFRYGLLASLPLIYLYTINFIMTNQAPIADWGLFR